MLRQSNFKSIKKNNANHFFPNGIDIDTLPELYHASLEQVISTIQETPNEYSSVLLIGHNPSMHESYEFLSGKLINKYPTCCLAALTYEGEWADIAQRSCDLDFIKKPRELR